MQEELERAFDKEQFESCVGPLVFMESLQSRLNNRKSFSQYFLYTVTQTEGRLSDCLDNRTNYRVKHHQWKKK